mgnify:CR=1 FL=1|jgi:hypothetical protein
MKTEFLDKRLERLEQLNLLRDLDFEEGRELAEIKRIKQLILSGVSKAFYCLEGGIKGSEHVCKKQCDSCNRFQQ